MLFVTAGLMIVVLFAEVFFWQEFQSRLNPSVFHYLSFPGGGAIPRGTILYQRVVGALALAVGVLWFFASTPTGVGQDSGPYLGLPLLPRSSRFFWLNP